MPIADLLLAEPLGAPVWIWAAFLFLVAAVLTVDLGLLRRAPHVISTREAAIASAAYVALGLLFGVWIWRSLGPAAAYDYWTAFVLEKTLAVDNLVVIAAIFSFLAIPSAYQHRVLVWGLIGVVLLRGALIAAGAAAVARYEWLLIVFAILLIVTGVKMLRMSDDGPDLAGSPLVKAVRRRLRVTEGLRGAAFFAREADPRDGRIRLFATPLLLALVLIELADVVFAVDSIPAVFTVTVNPFIVFTSNIFAILGLRALYFLLAALIERLPYLRFALGALLIFIGAKTIAVHALDVGGLPPGLTMGVTAAILGLGVLASLWRLRRA